MSSWILTEIPDYHTCGDCGSVVWAKGEGLKLHERWHRRIKALATTTGVLADGFGVFVMSDVAELTETY